MSILLYSLGDDGDLVSHKGQVLEVFKDQNDRVMWFTHSAQAPPGSSGSVVIDNDNCYIVGMSFGVLKNGTGCAEGVGNMNQFASKGVGISASTSRGRDLKAVAEQVNSEEMKSKLLKSAEECASYSSELFKSLKRNDMTICLLDGITLTDSLLKLKDFKRISRVFKLMISSLTCGDLSRPFGNKQPDMTVQQWSEKGNGSGKKCFRLDRQSFADGFHWFAFQMNGTSDIFSQLKIPDACLNPKVIETHLEDIKRAFQESFKQLYDIANSKKGPKKLPIACVFKPQPRSL